MGRQPRAKKKKHVPHLLARSATGPIRVAGISTTAINASYPRCSTSDAVLEAALENAR
jgi:hypothetical protein